MPHPGCRPPSTQPKPNSAALGEFEPPFLNVMQGSVNRKVQGSNPCPGASLAFGVAFGYCGAGTSGPHILLPAALRAGRFNKDSNSE